MDRTIVDARSGLSHLAARRPSTRTLAMLAVVVANAMWGASIVAGQAALERVPPLTLATVRTAAALAVLLPLLWRAGTPLPRGRTPALLGLTGVGLFYVCYNLGLGQTSATNATLILDGGMPVFIALLAAFVLGERLPGWGIVVSLLGIAVIVLVGHGGTPRLGFSVVGDLLLLAATLSWSVYTVVGRRVFAGAGLLATVAGASLYGLVFLAPAAAVELAFNGVGDLSPRDGVLLLYLGPGCSALTYVLIGYGLRHLEAGLTGVLGFVGPVTGLAAAATVGGESITGVQLGGAGLVLVGVWLVVRPRRAPAISVPEAAAPAAADFAVAGN